MNKYYDNNIQINGSEKEVLKVGVYLDTFYNCNVEKVSAEHDSGEQRLILQRLIDENKLWKVSILHNGNTVYSLKRIVKDFFRIAKIGITYKEFEVPAPLYNQYTIYLSKYLYEFFHLNFTIAHYNRFGWCQEYETFEDVKTMLSKYAIAIPEWKKDVQIIIDTICRNYKIQLDHKF